RVVEAAHARETARERDLAHGQLGFGEELLGEKEASGEHELHQRDAELLPHDAANVSRAPPDVLGDLLEARAVIEDALLYPIHHQRRDPLRIIHRSTPRSELRPTTQAGTEGGLLRSGRALEETAVGRARSPGSADGAAIDAGG